MGLVSFALKNPFTILAIALGLTLLSIAVVPSMPVDILPDFKTPMVVSFYSYPGMPTMEMEKCVAERLAAPRPWRAGWSTRNRAPFPGPAC